MPYLYEKEDNIDGKRYYYEVFTENDNVGTLNLLKVYITLRGIKSCSSVDFVLEKEDIAKILDSKISKLVKKLYQEHIDYKGEAVENDS